MTVTSLSQFLRRNFEGGLDIRWAFRQELACMAMPPVKVESRNAKALKNYAEKELEAHYLMKGRLWA